MLGTKHVTTTQHHVDLTPEATAHHIDLGRRFRGHVAVLDGSGRECLVIMSLDATGVDLDFRYYDLLESRWLAYQPGRYTVVLTE